MVGEIRLIKHQMLVCKIRVCNCVKPRGKTLSGQGVESHVT